MRHRWMLAALVLLPGCRDRRPDWAKQPESAMSGDATVLGEPLLVKKLASPIVIDGNLDEAAWQSAAAAGPFVAPGEGQVLKDHPVKGFARIAWDDTKLYLGVVVDDRSPFSPFTRDAVDPHIWEQSSAIELMIQPGDPGDNREYYEIQVDTAGAIFDTRWDDYNRPITNGPGGEKLFGHMDWSSKLERAVAIHEKAKLYSIEIAIPWSSFSSTRVSVPPKPGDVWRLNLYSFREGQRLALAWSPIKGQGNFHKSSRFGRVRFQ